MEITKEKFEAFVEVQKSGMTNMFDVRAVSELSDEIISTDEVKEIMKQYASLMEKYPEVYN
jgi:hypothetical protein|tara:strand:- start:793 stop:975 length:183 start_codon:yes stop_codon:yes gene_type:complete